MRLPEFQEALPYMLIAVAVAAALGMVALYDWRKDDSATMQETAPIQQAQPWYAIPLPEKKEHTQ